MGTLTVVTLREQVVLSGTFKPDPDRNDHPRRNKTQPSRAVVRKSS